MTHAQAIAHVRRLIKLTLRPLPCRVRWELVKAMHGNDPSFIKEIEQGADKLLADLEKRYSKYNHEQRETDLY